MEKQENKDHPGESEDEEGEGNDIEADGNKGEAERGTNADDKSVKPKNGPEKGDVVSWKWAGGQPEGKVLDVQADK